MNVWVVGCNGMLGSEVVRKLNEFGMKYTASDREVDITSIEAVNEQLNHEGPFDWIVNCAAWTAVDDAEKNEKNAAVLNAEAPGILARAASSQDTALLHISTDYVFDGQKTSPYLPTDKPAPLGVYGRTKLDGEEAIRKTLHRHVILRTAWLYGDNGNNFVHTMLALMKKNREIRVVSDQRGSPTWARNLSEAIVKILQTAKPQWGTYHYTDAGETSWYDYALEIGRLASEVGLLGSVPPVRPISSSDYATVAPRPAYSVLSCISLTEFFGIAPPPWRHSLRQFIRQKTVTDEADR